MSQKGISKLWHVTVHRLLFLAQDSMLHIFPSQLRNLKHLAFLYFIKNKIKMQNGKSLQYLSSMQ